MDCSHYAGQLFYLTQVSVSLLYIPLVILSYADVSVFVVCSTLLFYLTQVSSSLLYVPQAKAIKYEQALGKINEAFGSIAEFRREVSELTPKHKAATDSVHTLVEFVEQQKQDYIQVVNHITVYYREHGLCGLLASSVVCVCVCVCALTCMLAWMCMHARTGLHVLTCALFLLLSVSLSLSVCVCLCVAIVFLFGLLVGLTS